MGTWKPFRYQRTVGEGFITVTDNSGWQSIVKDRGLRQALEAKRDISVPLDQLPIFGFGGNYEGETLYTWTRKQGMNLE